MRSPDYPKSVCGVVFQGSARRTGCQFTFTCDGALRRPLPATVLDLGARSGPTADHRRLHPASRRAPRITTPSYVSPYWAPTLVRLGRIGAHIFYRTPAGSPLAAHYTPVAEPGLANMGSLLARDRSEHPGRAAAGRRCARAGPAGRARRVFSLGAGAALPRAPLTPAPTHEIGMIRLPAFLIVVPLAGSPAIPAAGAAATSAASRRCRCCPRARSTARSATRSISIRRRTRRSPTSSYEGAHPFVLHLPAVPAWQGPPPEPTADPEPVDPATRVLSDPDGIAADMAPAIPPGDRPVAGARRDDRDDRRAALALHRDQRHRHRERHRQPVHHARRSTPAASISTTSTRAAARSSSAARRPDGQPTERIT